LLDALLAGKGVDPSNSTFYGYNWSISPKGATLYKMVILISPPTMRHFSLDGCN